MSIKMAVYKKYYSNVMTLEEFYDMCIKFGEDRMLDIGRLN